jgi:PAS domain S-box-containing protein
MAKRDLEKLTQNELIEEVQRLENTLANDEALRATIHELEVHRDELHASQMELSDSRNCLEQSRDAYAALFDFAPIGYLILDAAGVVTDLNFTAASMLAAERGRLVGYPFASMVALHQRREGLDYLRRCRRVARGELSSDAPGGALEYEFELRRRGGGLVPVLVKTKAISRGPTRLSEFHMTLTDLTERKQLEAHTRRLEEERRLAEQQQQIARADSASKDHFIAVLSHELRTPLAPIRFAVASLRHVEPASDTLRRALDIIDRNVEHEARMIDDLLDATRIAQNRLHLVLGTVDVHRLVDDVLTVHAGYLQHAGVRVSMHLDAIAHLVRGDEGRLRQVLANLVRNACAHTPAGGHLTVATANPSSDRLAVTVRDDGRGIDPARLSRLFRPFQQVEPGRPSTGLGLGLSICKGIVDAHGGRIAATSTGLGNGATFTVELPAMAAAPASEPVAPPAVPVPEHAATTQNGVRVLLVEDNLDSAESMAALLEMFGYRVRVASSVQAALRAAEQDFDVLVSDIGLPDGTGRDLMRELSARRPVRGIALTGYGTTEDAIQNADAGFARHLVKPVDPNTLVATIGEVMQGRLGSGTNGPNRSGRR